MQQMNNISMIIVINSNTTWRIRKAWNNFLIDFIYPPQHSDLDFFWLSANYLLPWHLIYNNSYTFFIFFANESRRNIVSNYIVKMLMELILHGSSFHTWGGDILLGGGERTNLQLKSSPNNCLKLKLKINQLIINICKI